MQPAASLSQRRSVAPVAPLQALKFPILALDESRLTPALGYVFRKQWLYPHESLISILWKFERANGLSGTVLARLVGPDVDPYEGIAPCQDVIDVDRLRLTLGLPLKTLRASLIRQREQRSCKGVFRYCRRCLSRGYHSVVHQFEGTDQCPAHRCALEAMCQRCGCEAPYRVNVQLLEAPYRCGNCLMPYTRPYWLPNIARPMIPEHRTAFTRRYFARCWG
ncbi:TniQ family protein [Burkholderia sp. Ac-20365]|uniref:TniQ family protein n=1 Tax=Burkholderia sp. Ac-20365 TaxID=2703897 RepID=UPI00197B117F|nr:TniQ family protein [Burkholderia sp. Ac-20365]MBN3760758.1 hypothetical protein [Burkholderia sp. Ac-20365]